MKTVMHCLIDWQFTYIGKNAFVFYSQY